MLSVSVNHPAISGTFEVDRGLIAVVGLSGAGKTSLFRLLAGLDRSPAAVSFENQRIDGLLPHQRPLAYVPQHPSLVPHKTIAAQVRWVQATDDQLVQRWRQILALDRLWERYPRELSGGEQQRAALLRALAANRPLLILDESLSNVDKPHRDHIFEALHEQWSTRLLLFSTHDWREAENWADGVLYVEHGQLYAVQPRRDLAPVTWTMARLMGFLGAIHDDHGRAWLIHPRLVQVGRHSSGLYIPGLLTVTDRYSIQSQYHFQPADGGARLHWQGPPIAPGTYQGITLTRRYAATSLLGNPEELIP